MLLLIKYVDIYTSSTALFIVYHLISHKSSNIIKVL